MAGRKQRMLCLASHRGQCPALGINNKLERLIKRKCDDTFSDWSVSRCETRDWLRTVSQVACTHQQSRFDAGQQDDARPVQQPVVVQGPIPQLPANTPHSIHAPLKGRGCVIARRNISVICLTIEAWRRQLTFRDEGGKSDPWPPSTSSKPASWGVPLCFYHSGW